MAFKRKDFSQCNKNVFKNNKLHPTEQDKKLWIKIKECVVKSKALKEVTGNCDNTKTNYLKQSNLNSELQHDVISLPLSSNLSQMSPVNDNTFYLSSWSPKSSLSSARCDYQIELNNDRSRIPENFGWCFDSSFLPMRNVNSQFNCIKTSLSKRSVTKKVEPTFINGQASEFCVPALFPRRRSISLNASAHETKKVMRSQAIVQIELPDNKITPSQISCYENERAQIESVHSPIVNKFESFDQKALEFCASSWHSFQNYIESKTVARAPLKTKLPRLLWRNKVKNRRNDVVNSKCDIDKMNQTHLTYKNITHDGASITLSKLDDTASKGVIMPAKFKDHSSCDVYPRAESVLFESNNTGSEASVRQQKRNTASKKPMNNDYENNFSILAPVVLRCCTPKLAMPMQGIKMQCNIPKHITCTSDVFCSNTTQCDLCNKSWHISGVNNDVSNYVNISQNCSSPFNQRTAADEEKEHLSARDRLRLNRISSERYLNIKSYMNCKAMKKFNRIRPLSANCMRNNINVCDGPGLNDKNFNYKFGNDVFADIYTSDIPVADTVTKQFPANAFYNAETGDSEHSVAITTTRNTMKCGNCQLIEAPKSVVNNNRQNTPFFIQGIKCNQVGRWDNALVNNDIISTGDSAVLNSNGTASIINGVVLTDNKSLNGVASKVTNKRSYIKQPIPEVTYHDVSVPTCSFEQKAMNSARSTSCSSLEDENVMKQRNDTACVCKKASDVKYVPCNNNCKCRLKFVKRRNTTKKSSRKIQLAGVSIVNKNIEKLFKNNTKIYRNYSNLKNNLIQNYENATECSSNYKKVNSESAESLFFAKSHAAFFKSNDHQQPKQFSDFKIQENSAAEPHVSSVKTNRKLPLCANSKRLETNFTRTAETKTTQDGTTTADECTKNYDKEVFITECSSCPNHVIKKLPVCEIIAIENEQHSDIAVKIRLSEHSVNQSNNIDNAEKSSSKIHVAAESSCNIIDTTNNSVSTRKVCDNYTTKRARNALKYDNDASGYHAHENTFCNTDALSKNKFITRTSLPTRRFKRSLSTSIKSCTLLLNLPIKSEFEREIYRPKSTHKYDYFNGGFPLRKRSCFSAVFRTKVCASLSSIIQKKKTHGGKVCPLPRASIVNEPTSICTKRSLSANIPSKNDMFRHNPTDTFSTHLFQTSSAFLHVRHMNQKRNLSTLDGNNHHSVRDEKREDIGTGTLNTTTLDDVTTQYREDVISLISGSTDRIFSVLRSSENLHQLLLNAPASLQSSFVDDYQIKSTHSSVISDKASYLLREIGEKNNLIDYENCDYNKQVGIEKVNGENCSFNTSNERADGIRNVSARLRLATNTQDNFAGVSSEEKLLNAANLQILGKAVNIRERNMRKKLLCCACSDTAIPSHEQRMSPFFRQPESADCLFVNHVMTNVSVPKHRKSANDNNSDISCAYLHRGQVIHPKVYQLFHGIQ